jgi:hypothetical protein
MLALKLTTLLASHITINIAKEFAIITSICNLPLISPSLLNDFISSKTAIGD